MYPEVDFEEISTGSQVQFNTAVLFGIWEMHHKDTKLIERDTPDAGSVTIWFLSLGVQGPPQQKKRPGRFFEEEVGFVSRISLSSLWPGPHTFLLSGW